MDALADYSSSETARTGDACSHAAFALVRAAGDGEKVGRLEGRDSVIDIIRAIGERMDEGCALDPEVALNVVTMACAGTLPRAEARAEPRPGQARRKKRGAASAEFVQDTSEESGSGSDEQGPRLPGPGRKRVRATAGTPMPSMPGGEAPADSDRGGSMLPMSQAETDVVSLSEDVEMGGVGESDSESDGGIGSGGVSAADAGEEDRPLAGSDESDLSETESFADPALAN